MSREITWVHSVKQERESLGQKAGMEQRQRPAPEFLKKVAPRGLIVKDRSSPPHDTPVFAPDMNGFGRMRSAKKRQLIRPGRSTEDRAGAR